MKIKKTPRPAFTSLIFHMDFFLALLGHAWGFVYSCGNTRSPKQRLSQRTFWRKRTSFWQRGALWVIYCLGVFWQKFVLEIPCPCYLGMEQYTKFRLLMKRESWSSGGKGEGPCLPLHNSFTLAASLDQRSGGHMTALQMSWGQSKASTCATSPWNGVTAAGLQLKIKEHWQSQARGWSLSLCLSISPLQLARPRQGKPLAAWPSTSLGPAGLRAWGEPRAGSLGTWPARASPWMRGDRSWESWMKGLPAWWPVQRPSPNMHTR